MQRLPAIPFERPVPVSDVLEESSSARDDWQLNQLKLGTAWLCATIGGVAALAYASIAEVSSPTTMIGLAVLLVAYTGYGYSVPKKNTIQFADSLYYMGFLWAIFALIATFILWPAAKLTTDAVLTTFGYALVATFCGMLLRLLIIQFHDTKPDRLVQAQATIDRHVAALVQQLNDATMEITSFRHRAASDLGGTVHDLVRSLADVREMIAEEYRTMANTMRESFEIPHEMLTAEVTKLAATLEIQGEGFERAAQRLETSLIRAADTATAIGDSLHASDAVKQVGAAINELSGKIKDRSEQFVHMTTALEKSRAELDGQLHSLHELRSAVATVSSHLSAFETELREVSSASISVEVKNGLMNVQQAINSTLEASKAIESTMRGVLFFMRDRVTEEHPSGRN